MITKDDLKPGYRVLVEAIIEDTLDLRALRLVPVTVVGTDALRFVPIASIKSVERPIKAQV